MTSTTTPPSLRKSKVVTAVLAVAGLSGIAIGSAILFAPLPFFSSTGVDLGDNPSLLSDIRGLGVLLLGVGALTGVGAFVPRLAFTGALVGAVAFLGYVAARALSIAVDGVPDSSILAAHAAELVLGLACLFVLMRYRTPRTS